ncbi:hypothetical protein RRG08_043372 [Elysia crispata]|uniref:Uncharacterized protein n=1 Tax=Elysia crispata TaxID=231223 RepID=A0AAE0Z5H5_9GAST|nr:hypothetical protein RRG08_043372 [Elysia crispata]
MRSILTNKTRAISERFGLVTVSDAQFTDQQNTSYISERFGLVTVSDVQFTDQQNTSYISERFGLVTLKNSCVSSKAFPFCAAMMQFALACSAERKEPTAVLQPGAQCARSTGKQWRRQTDKSLFNFCSGCP